MRQWTVGLIFATLLTGCMGNGKLAEEHKPQLLIEKKSSGSQQFAYQVQLRGGRYMADPRLNEYLTVVGKRLIRLAGYKALVVDFSVVNSAKADAWVDPEGRIAVTRGMLLILDNEAELAALLGHLLTHAAMQHAADALTRDDELDRHVLKESAEHHYATSIVGDGLQGLAGYIVQYSHAAEMQADAAAIKIMIKAGYDPQAAADLQLKMLSNKTVALSQWLHHHPATQERLAANRRAARVHPPSLMLAERSYKKALLKLKKSEKSYQILQQAEQLLTENKLEEGYTLARTAAKKNLREGRFLALEGDALQKMGALDNALKAYDLAITHDPEYYLYPLRRAELHRLKENEPAVAADLHSSIQLLPTAKAYLYLAQQVERQSALALAQVYYQRAAESSTVWGVQAENEAQRVDFDKNPDRYIHIKHSKKDTNSIMLFISNLNPYPIQVESMLLTADKIYRVKLDKKIPSGTSISSTVTIQGLGVVRSVSVEKAQLLLE